MSDGKIRPTLEQLNILQGILANAMAELVRQNEIQATTVITLGAALDALQERAEAHAQAIVQLQVETFPSAAAKYEQVFAEQDRKKGSEGSGEGGMQN